MSAHPGGHSTSAWCYNALTGRTRHDLHVPYPTLYLSLSMAYARSNTFILVGMMGGGGSKAGRVGGGTVPYDPHAPP